MSERSDLAYQALRSRSTAELLDIWTNNDREEWSDDAFVAIRRLLVERRVGAPRQRHPPGPRQAPESPAWALCRLESRRRWGWRGVRGELLVLFAIVAVEHILMYYTHWRVPATGYVTLGPVGRAVGLLFDSIVVWGCYPVPPVLSRADHLAIALSALPGAAACFLLPRRMALAVAPLRRSGWIEQLAVAGLRPRDILLGLALGSAGPVVLLSMGAWLAVRPWTSLDGGLHVLYHPFVVSALAASLVAISALSRDVTSALAACYSLVAATVVLLGTPGALPLRFALGPFPDSRTGVALLSVVPAAILVPLALRTLRYPRSRLP